MAGGGPGDETRRLIRQSDRAVLATTLAGDGWPYGSLVLAACDHDATPLLLLSDLAEHSKNIASDDRVSLLVDGTAGLDDPLTGARATLVGRLEATGVPKHRMRFVNRHPGAAGYADFADFNFYRLEIERAHLVAGFGKIDWVAPADILTEVGRAAALVEAEPDILQHMNQDHADAVQLFASAFLGEAGGGWHMTGVDPEGCDLRRGGTVGRIDFDDAVQDADTARQALILLTKRAREGITE